MDADAALLDAHLHLLGTAREAADATAAGRADTAAAEAAYFSRACTLSAAEAKAAEVADAARAVEALRGRVAAARAEGGAARVAALADRERTAAAAAAAVGSRALDGAGGFVVDRLHEYVAQRKAVHAAVLARAREVPARAR